MQTIKRNIQVPLTVPTIKPLCIVLAVYYGETRQADGDIPLYDRTW